MDNDQIKLLGMLIASFILSSILVAGIQGHQDNFAYEVCGTAFDPYTPARNACEHAIKTVDRDFFLSVGGGMFFTIPTIGVIYFFIRDSKG